MSDVFKVKKKEESGYKKQKKTTRDTSSEELCDNHSHPSVIRIKRHYLQQQ